MVIPCYSNCKIGYFLEILFSLKTIELLANRLQPHSVVTPLFSVRTVSLASSQRCRRIDADARCKRALVHRARKLCV